MENLDIKICLVAKFVDVVSNEEFEKKYILKEAMQLKVCLIMNDIAYDLDSDLEFPILEINEEGRIEKEIEINKSYIYQMFEYGNVYLNDELIFKPKWSNDVLYRKAYSRYLNNKNVVSYEKFLQKKKERK